MRKISLPFFFAVITVMANAQWQKVTVPHGSDAIAISDMEVPNANTVWASASVLSGTSYVYANKYLRTADSGATWQYSSVTAPSGYVISNIYPIDADTCYAAMFNSSVGLGGGIFKTTDGGTTWNQLAAGQIFDGNSFPNFVYFYNAKEGIAMGDGNGPGTPYLEIYTTSDYGATWTRVPRANLPSTVDHPYGITNRYTVSGERIWMQVFESPNGYNLSSQYIYRSDDKGLHWTGYKVPIPIQFGDLAFIDQTTGFILGKDDSGNPYLYRSTDGGETWGNAVSYTGPLMGAYITNIPGTNAIVTTNPYVGGPEGSAISYDLGDTWTAITLASGTDYLHSDVKFLNSSVGWSGQALTTSNQKGGMYKWTGTDTLCCTPPKRLNATVTSDTSATLQLKPSACGEGLIYQIQIKPVNSGSTKWKTLTGTDLTFKIKTLKPSTTYQWQVATVCQTNPLVLSTYKAGTNFTTTSAIAAIAENNDIKVAGSLCVNIFPNPAGSTAVLRISNASSVNITVTDLSGKTLWQSFNVKKQQVNMPVEKFAKGIYIVAVSNSTETKVIKLMKQ